MTCAPDENLRRSLFFGNFGERLGDMAVTDNGTSLYAFTRQSSDKRVDQRNLGSLELFATTFVSLLDFLRCQE